MIHTDLDAWKEAMKLAELIYLSVKRLPKSEDFILSAQLRKTAISVPSNIAEGAARKGTGEFRQSCYIALGSIAELETQLLLAQRMCQLDIENEMTQLVKVRKLTLGLINHLNK